MSGLRRGTPLFSTGLRPDPDRETTGCTKARAVKGVDPALGLVGQLGHDMAPGKGAGPKPMDENNACIWIPFHLQSSTPDTVNGHTLNATHKSVAACESERQSMQMGSGFNRHITRQE